jgi:drug/metabolite transporter (DMT)-like permease
MSSTHVLPKPESHGTFNHKLLAILGALLMVFIWSGWIILSRVGVQSSLSPEDITFLRFGTGAFCALPFSLRYDWKKLTLWKAVVVSLGCGFPYTMFSFYGLQTIKAANAGVIVNGLLPVFGAILAFVVLEESSTRKRILAIAIILAANLIMMGNPSDLGDEWLGWLMLLAASMVFSSYMFLGKRWGFTVKDVLAFLPLINAVLFFPIWLASDSGIPDTNFSAILTQSLYQGVLVSVVALMLTFYAIQHIGAMSLSIFFSFVPFVTAMLAWLILGESLSVQEILAIVLCSVGLVIYASRERMKQ